MKRLSFHTGDMKANPRLLPSSRSLLMFPLMAGAILLPSCVPQVAPPSRPTPAPTTATPTPAPAAPAQPASNWQDAPITPGDWQWGMTSLGSTATFAGGQFSMRCDASRRTIILTRAGQTSSRTTMTITTDQGARALAASPISGGIAVSLPARDPVLDAMAFSRGRFAIAIPGTTPLYIPSWTEISRVIEDCR